MNIDEYCELSPIELEVHKVVVVLVGSISVLCSINVEAIAVSKSGENVKDPLLDADTLVII